MSRKGDCSSYPDNVKQPALYFATAGQDLALVVHLCAVRCFIVTRLTTVWQNLQQSLLLMCSISTASVL
jgi:hypothetical protein